VPTIVPLKPGIVVYVPRRTTQTQPDGSLAPAPPQTVTTTDPTSIVPWPGAAPIPGIGPAPRANLLGIARELGKIERKIEAMMDQNSPSNLLDKFGDIGNIVGQILQAITALSADTTYELDSPCELDESGNRLPPVVVPVPGALTQFQAILNRCDALAELLQVHKDLKQPNCKPPPTAGEFVTVNFEQIN
jgi:hypothetical protein